MFKKIILAALVLCCASCTQKTENTNAEIKYFDLTGYFTKEIARLKKLNPSIKKLVSTNGDSEQKIVKIENWDKELAVFMDADINKKAWKDSFKIIKTNTSITYLALDGKIAVRQLFIQKSEDKIQQIALIIHKKNALYTSDDTLIYQPNILYQIKKQQNIKLLAPKTYNIIGRF